MTTNLTAISSSKNDLLPSASEFQMFQTISRAAKASGLYGGDENKVFMILLAARELGIPPLQALNGSLWNIQGKIEISARCMNSMIRRAGHSMKITSTATECVIIGKRSDTGEEHTETFTWAMAERAGLASGNVWKKYPEDMLYNRCMSRLARRLFPDIIGVAYVEGEIKEAIEAEKQLPQAECQDITPSKETIAPNCTEIVPIIPINAPNQGQFNTLSEPKLTSEQITHILDGLSKCTKEYQDNYDANILNHWKATNTMELPQKAYPILMASMQRNLDMQEMMKKEKEVENE